MHDTEPMQTTPLSTRIEGILFVEGTTIRIDKLTRLLGAAREEIEVALETLAQRYEHKQQALQLVRTEDAVALALTPALGDELSALQKQATEKDIGPAGLEVLAILLYRGPATRARIDYIRGVNSTSTVRNLLMHGLIERVKNPENAREVVYKPSVELLGHLGVSQASELPEYAQIRETLTTFEARLSAAEDGGEKENHADTS